MATIKYFVSFNPCERLGVIGAGGVSVSYGPENFNDRTPREVASLDDMKADLQRAAADALGSERCAKWEGVNATANLLQPRKPNGWDANRGKRCVYAFRAAAAVAA